VVEPADLPPRFVASGVYFHEWALLVLGSITLGLLTVVAGPLHRVSVEVAAAMALYATALMTLRGVAAWPDRARFVATCGFVVWFFLAVARITPALGTPLRDAQLYALDQAFFGGTPALQWQAYASGSLTELFSAAYLSYFVYLNIAVIHALCQTVADRYRLAAPLVSAYVVGFCGYLLVPAVGPSVALARDFTSPLTGGPFTRLNDSLVTQGSSVYDVFPSLHVLITCVLLDHDRRYARRRFWVMLAPACLLFVSTVYLRYHYLVDVAAGFACFLAIFLAMCGLNGAVHRQPAQDIRNQPAKRSEAATRGPVGLAEGSLS